VREATEATDGAEATTTAAVAAEIQQRQLAVLLVAAALLEDEEAARVALAEAGPADGAAAHAPDVIYVPTPQPVVDRMLELADVQEGDVVYDLGCGDGRIVVTAAVRYGVKAWGFDVDPERVVEARANVRAAGVEDLVTIENKDIFTLDLSPASVVMLYLLPELNVRLIPQLEQLAPGSRVVSHDFDMQGVTPLEQVTMRVAPDFHEIYLWQTPFTRDAEAGPPDSEAAPPAKTAAEPEATPAPPVTTERSE
jgi:SAM-dependent methyltransferase